MVDELSTVASVQLVRVQCVRTARSCSRDMRVVGYLQRFTVYICMVGSGLQIIRIYFQSDETQLAVCVGLN
jgi:hypothetical protein